LGKARINKEEVGDFWKEQQKRGEGLLENVEEFRRLLVADFLPPH
jgi:hypothetical protein